MGRLNQKAVEPMVASFRTASDTINVNRQSLSIATSNPKKAGLNSHGPSPENNWA